MLTGEKREKVKVLAVLYDGGKHADEVRFSHLLMLSNLDPYRPNSHHL